MDWLIYYSILSAADCSTQSSNQVIKSNRLQVIIFMLYKGILRKCPINLKVSSFLGYRKSRTFDIEGLVNENKKNAALSRRKADSDEDSDDDASVARTNSRPVLSAPRGPSGPTMPPSLDSGTESDIGPSLPSSSATQSVISSGGPTNLSADLMDSDSDFSDSEEKTDDTSADWKVPCAYDITFEHGDKAVNATSFSCPLFNFDWLIDWLIDYKCISNLIDCSSDFWLIFLIALLKD